MADETGSILPDLVGRRALVTGGANGIGRACAARLASAGATVVVADLDGEGAERTAVAIGGESVQIDLSQLDAIADLGGEFDIVVNNAGLQHISSLVDFPEDRFSLILRVMLEAPFRIIRQTLPHMYGQGWGRIVNISSVHGLVASPFKSAYVTAKHGLEGLSKATALEAASHGVTSNCINPGYVRTALVEKQISDQAVAHGMTQEQVVSEVLLERAALKRLLEPDEVASMAGYLCSSAAGAITGTSVVIDGGWTAH